MIWIITNKTRRESVKVCAAAMGVLVLAGIARAQDATQRRPEAPGVMGPRYVDGSFGFAVTPPAGCEILREKRFIGTDDVEIVRFVNPNALWSLGVRQSKPQRALDPESLGQMVVQELQGVCPDVSIVKSFRSEAASRETLRCEAVMTTRGVPVLRQQAMIRVKPSEYFALVLVTPREDEKTGAAAFEKILGSFEILRSELAEQQLREALARGSALLQLVATGSLDVSGEEPREVFLRYLEGGQEAGFMQIRVEPRTVDHRKGATIFKWLWFFPPDGSATLMQQDMFITDTLAFERWESRRITVSPPPRGAGQREILHEIESGIRHGDKLLVGYAGKSTGRQITEKEIDLDRTYASAPWEVLLPTVVDLTKPQLYAFSWYDSTRRGLSLQTFRIVGPRTLPGGGQATLIEQSEGLVPPIHELWVDRDGQLVRVVMNLPDKRVEMAATTRQDVERKYGAKVKELEKLMPGPASAPAADKAAGKADRAK